MLCFPSGISQRDQGGIQPACEQRQAKKHYRLDKMEETQPASNDELRSGMEPAGEQRRAEKHCRVDKMANNLRHQFPVGNCAVAKKAE